MLLGRELAEALEISETSLVNHEINKNVVWHNAAVTKAHREQMNGHRAMVVWLTGLSGAGKSTLAHAVEQRLHNQGRRTFVLDGDNVRHGLCNDLGFSRQDRRENIRRAAEMSKLFVDAGLIVLAAFISPLNDDRTLAKQIVGSDNFLEIHVHCPLEVCETRDVKGMYRLARAGEIREFTGISAPYEPPENPDLVLETNENTIDQSVTKIISLLEDKLVLS